MTTGTKSTDFNVEVTDRAPGYNAPQKMGRRLWGPMWVMAIMAFPVAFIIGTVRANEIASGGSEATASALLHVQAGIMFVGFAAVFAAISFAIARILGAFRKGGGEVQETLGVHVLTPKMPPTARVFMIGLMVAMLTIVIASIIHFFWAGAVAGGTVTLVEAEEAFILLEAVRRLGVALYLVAITFGLATITKVLRFQAIRVR
ncbi:MAG: hypothetical protein R3212_13790, partial [Xanthomonadales bacterium]|nr:hypothetical protein [Xanthomonadales bacterium]